MNTDQACLREAGQGPGVLCLHANASSSAQWRALMDRLAAHFHVLAADGYPLTPRKGDAITALPVDTAEAVVFHAGTQLVEGELQTSGGRVLCATALGATVRQAQANAYALVQGVSFAGMQYRKDIGYRALG